MSHLLGLKEEIIKASQEYYNATSAEDKQKHKESLQKTFKKFHKFMKCGRMHKVCKAAGMSKS